MPSALAVLEEEKELQDDDADAEAEHETTDETLLQTAARKRVCDDCHIDADIALLEARVLDYRDEDIGMADPGARALGLLAARVLGLPSTETHHLDDPRVGRRFPAFAF